MFDDKNYTKAKTGSGIGSLLSNYANAAQNRQRTDLMKKELEYKNPYRPIGPLDIAGALADTLKTQSLYSGMPGVTPSDPAKTTENLVSAFQSLQSMLNGGGPVSSQNSNTPALPSVPSAGSVLDKYLTEGGQPPNVQVPQGPNGTQPTFLKNNAPTAMGVAPSTNSAPVVNRAGTSYKALWTR